MKTKLYHFLLLAFLLGMSQSVSAQIGPVDFTASATTGCGSLLTSFTATPANPNYTYHWDFGSVTDGTETNYGVATVNHLFRLTPSSSCRTITLTITDAAGQIASVQKANYICVYGMPVANFAPAPGSTTVDCAPICVQFIDQSTPGTGANSIVSRQWSSGGGTPSSVGFPSSPIGFGAPGIPNPSFCYNTAGNYAVTLTATDNHGCSTSITKANSVRVMPTPLITLTSSNTSSCLIPFTVACNININNVQGVPGVVSVICWGDSTAGSPNPCQSISNSSGVLSHTYTRAGSYTVFAVSSTGSGCSDTAFLKYVTVGGAVDFTASQYKGCKDAPINFTTSSGTLPVWDFGDGSPLSTDLNPSHIYTSPMDYNVTLTIRLPGGCILTKTKSIHIVSPPNAHFTLQNKYSSNLPAAPVITNLPAIPPRGFITWDFGGAFGHTNPPNNIPNYTMPGKHPISVTLTDSSNCSATYSDTLYINPIQANFGLSKTGGCVPYTTQFSVSGSKAPSGGGGQGGFANYPIVSTKWYLDNNPTPFFSSTSPTAPPDYTFANSTTCQHAFKMVIENSVGVRDSITKTILGSDKPTATFSFSPGTTCTQFPITFYGTTTPGASGCPINRSTWSFGDNTYERNFILNPIHAYNDTALFYQNNHAGFKPWLIVESGGCPSDTIFGGRIIMTPPIARFTIEQNCTNRLCVNLHVTDNPFPINNSLGDRFSWMVTEIGGSGTVPTIPTTTMPTNPNQPVCFTHSGTYEVVLTVTDLHSGCSKTASKTITIANPTISISTSALTGCAPLSVNLSSTSTDSAYIAAYQWTANTPTAQLSNITNKTSKAVFTTPGLYSNAIKLQTTDVNGCIDSIRSNNAIIRGIFVSFNATPTSGCTPATINLTNTSSIYPPGSTISHVYWDFENNGSPTFYDGAGNTASFTVLNSGTYSVKMVVQSSSGCKDSLIRTVFTGGSPTADFTPAHGTPTTGCAPLCVQFIDQSVVNAGANNIVSWQWSASGGFPSTIGYPSSPAGYDATNITNPTFCFNSAGNYFVTLSVTDDNGCVNSTTKPVVAVDPPTVSFTADETTTFCPPLLVTFTNTTSNITASNWSVKDSRGVIIGSSNLNPYQYLFIEPDDYTITLVTTNSTGCVDSLVEQNYIHIGGPKGTFSFSPQSGCLPLTAQFAISNISNNSPNTTTQAYIDAGATGSICHAVSAPNNLFTYPCAGVYNPTMLLVDGNGCTRTIDHGLLISVDDAEHGFVYPGDANYDGTANNLDLLPIALNTGTTGPPRSNPNIQWVAASCYDAAWFIAIQNTNTDLKHVDCDGNGTIQAVDTLAILQNYGMVHQRQPLVTFANAPSISCIFPSDTTHNASYPYTLQSSVNVGDAANPATDITGLAFTINYDNTLADAAYINLDNFSWLGAPNELYHLQHDDGQGHLDVAISRFDGGMRNGFGRVATCNFVITDNVIGRGLTSINYPFNVSCSQIKAIDNQNNNKPMNGAATNTVFTNMILATSENNLAQRIRLYPNPLSANSLQFNMEGLNCESIAIFNTLGQLVFNQKTANKSQFSLELPELMGGIYWVEMNTNAGKAVKKLVVSR